MPYTVLIIDDEPNFCTGLQLLLQTEDYEVKIAHTGQEALFQLATINFDAVVLDLGLPDISGLDLAGILKEKYPDTAVIVLTGCATLDNAIQALRGGVYDYLRKPLPAEQVLRTLARGIEFKRLKRKLRNSEKRFRQLSRATWEGIIIYDNGDLLHANEQLCAMFGYSEEELLGQPIFEILLDRETVKPNHLQAAPGTIGPFEATAIRKDGHRFPVEIRVKQIDYDGRSAQVAAIRDITANKKAQEKERLLQQKLDEAKRMEFLGLMAGSVAHDLNNIMSGILTYPELLLMDLPENFKYRNEIKMIRDAGKRAAAVVNDLLTLARGVSSKKEVHNVNDLITSYLGSVECKELHSRYPGLAISSELEPDLANIRCSPVHVNKALVNLVNNGAEAAAENGSIRISTANLLLKTAHKGYEVITPGEYAVLAVTDNGNGIKARDLPHIFEPFYSKKVLGRSGTGLGLAVVWNTVHDHGGFIDVETSPAGTTFFLYFPVTHQEKDSSLPNASIHTWQGHGEKILVVDDQQNQLEIASRLLGRLGYTVHTASSGEEAVEFIKKQPVDLVLLDMVMDPGINGCETFERIVRHNPDQKAIIISGYSSCQDISRAKQLGISQFIKKPYTLHDLSQAVRHEIC